MTMTMSAPQRAHRKPKILIVDDREENLIALERLLSDLDLDLYKATSGNEALRITLHHDFALALLDIQMPGMDGYELAQILRDEEKTARLPFIFISAIYKDHINIFKGYEKGAFSYITKPFEPEVLTNKVKFFIEKHQQEQALKDMHLILEERVKARTAELERSNADLEQFAYVASHDLQEPLRMVASYVELLQHRYADKLDKDAHEYIGFAVDGAMRMKQLINDLLSFSRSTKTSDPVPLELDAVLVSVLDNLKSAIRERNALITNDPLPTVVADRTGMVQVFQNLLTNAIKFSAQGVRPLIHIGVSEGAGEWTFSVRDNGIGIDERYAPKVFKIFAQLNSKTSYPGTGIGLSVARKIIERAGGRIWLRSQLGQGSTFYFTILKSASSVPAALAERHAPAGRTDEGGAQ
jgi:two-component system, sensor histidine kinase and response regulator